jgi:hypothetical protein
VRTSCYNSQFSNNTHCLFYPVIATLLTLPSKPVYTNSHTLRTSINSFGIISEAKHSLQSAAHYSNAVCVVCGATLPLSAHPRCYHRPAGEGLQGQGNSTVILFQAAISTIILFQASISTIILCQAAISTIILCQATISTIFLCKAAILLEVSRACRHLSSYNCSR